MPCPGNGQASRGLKYGLARLTIGKPLVHNGLLRSSQWQRLWAMTAAAPLGNDSAFGVIAGGAKQSPAGYAKLGGLASSLPLLAVTTEKFRVARSPLVLPSPVPRSRRLPDRRAR